MRGQVKVYQKKIIAKRRRRIFFLTLYFFGAIALIVSGLSFVSQLESISIDRIVVEGNIRTTTADVENIVLENVSGNYLNLFSKRNTFLYPKQEIEEKLLALPTIDRVDVSRRGLGVLVVSLIEKKETALWCRGEGMEECFSIDQEGLIYDSLEDTCEGEVCTVVVSTSTHFVYRGNVEGDVIGKNFLPSSDFKKINFFIEQIERLEVKPVYASIADTGYVTIGLFGGGKFIINSHDDLTKVLGNLAAILADKTIVSNLSQFLSNLDYLKLDAGNKMVYKMKL